MTTEGLKIIPDSQVERDKCVTQLHEWVKFKNFDMKTSKESSRTELAFRWRRWKISITMHSNLQYTTYHIFYNGTEGNGGGVRYCDTDKFYFFRRNFMKISIYQYIGVYFNP